MLRILHTILILSLCTVLPVAVTAASEINDSQGNISFIDNKGQWEPMIKYKAAVPGGAVFITDKGLVYNFYSMKDMERFHEHYEHTGSIDTATMHYHSYSVTLSGASASFNCSTDDRRSYYHNYFLGNDTSKWKGHVPLFGKMTRKDVYRGIDMAIYSHGSALKYDFIVAPGADPSLISLQFEGVQPTIAESGSLKISTTVNEVTEAAPYVFQVIDGERKEVKCKYRLDEGKLTFDLYEGYDKAYPLVIDPAVVFITYSGSTGSNLGHCTTYDDDGNLYGASWPGTADWPATIGAFQLTIGGSFDAGINKYNAAGTSLVFSTYYGGNGTETPHAMRVNDQGELILMGSTGSDNLPVTPGCYDDSLGGNKDYFVVRFNAAGSAILGATYVGGSLDEADIMYNEFHGTELSTGEIILDTAGNVWVCGNTLSSDFPTTAGAVQHAFGGGKSDAVLFRLNADYSQLTYSTYLGGVQEDAAYGLAMTKAGHMVISGATRSVNFPVSWGALHMQPRGNADGFVSIINPSVNDGLLRSTYLGTNNFDLAYAIQVDRNDNVYVLGQTRGNYPITPGVYATPGADIFVDKLNPQLSASMVSTRLGNQQTASLRFVPCVFMIDRCENVYVIGSNNRPLNAPPLPTTPGAFETTGKIFIWVMEPDFANLRFASYIGTAWCHLHQGVSRITQDGMVYYSSCTNVPTHSTSSGAFAPVGLSPSLDLLSFKLNLEDLIDQDTLGKSTMMKVCFRDSVYIDPAGLPGQRYYWSNGQVTTGGIWISKSGIYTCHYEIDGYCEYYIDTFDVSIEAAPKVSVQDSTCPGKKMGRIEIITQPGQAMGYTYNAFNKSTGALLSSGISDTGIVLVGLDQGLYEVNIQTPSGCDTTLAFTISAVPGINLTISNDTAILPGGRVQLWASGASTYQWQPAKWLDSPNIATPLAMPRQPITYTVNATNEYGCEATASVHIHVNDHLFLPNVFSPNGDGRNDVFRLGNLGYKRVQEFLIFNRWGELVFSTTDGKQGWDGTYKGVPADLGTYFYTITIEMTDYSIKKLKGDVTLIR